MAARKRKTDTESAADGNGNGNKPTALGRKDHHAPLKGKGGVMITASRPRNQPYILEEWLMPDRRLRILKVLDDGGIVAYAEESQHADPTSLGQ